VKTRPTRVVDAVASGRFNNGRSTINCFARPHAAWNGILSASVPASYPIDAVMTRRGMLLRCIAVITRCPSDSSHRTPPAERGCPPTRVTAWPQLYARRRGAKLAGQCTPVPPRPQ